MLKKGGVLIALDGQLHALRDRNRRRVIGQLRESGQASQAEIARRTGLSRTTISTIVAELSSEGLLVRVGPASRDHPSVGGRRPVMLRLDDSADVIVGVDIGRGHMRAAVATISHEVLAEVDREIAEDTVPSMQLDETAGLVQELLAKAGIEFSQAVGFGLGLPVRVDRGSCLAGPNPIFSGWAGVRAAEHVGTRLGVAVEVENATNLAALAETCWGAATGCSEVFYLNAALTIEAGIIHRGRVHSGATGIAGEIGHTAVEPTGRPCYCGSRGCLETIAAVPALMEILHPGDSAATLADALARARLGHGPTRRVVAEAGRQIGFALANVCNLLNPQCIVVGGQLAGAGDLLLEPISQSINRHAVQGAAEAVKVVRADFGARAGVMGALALALIKSQYLTLNETAGQSPATG